MRCENYPVLGLRRAWSSTMAMEKGKEELRTRETEAFYPLRALSNKFSWRKVSGNRIWEGSGEGGAEREGAM